MKRLLIGLIAFNCVFGVAKSQSADEWNWPEDKAPAEEKYVLYKDALRTDNYKAAKAPHMWLMNKVPDLHNSLYIDGAKIYEGLAEIESDPARKIELQDSALIMYDLRIKYFNDEANVMNRKAYQAYKYYRSDQDRYEDLFQTLKKTYDLNGDNIANYLIVPYMDILRKYKLSGGDISDEAVLDTYNELLGVLDKMEKTGKKAGRVDTYRDQLDKLLTATIDVNCEFIENNMYPKIEANPDDIEQAQKVLSLMYAAECGNTDMFLETVKVIYGSDKTYGLAYVLGIKYIQREKYEEAEQYLKEAIELTEDNTKKAEIYMNLGNIANLQGKKSTAREHFLAAVGVDPTQKEAYKKIGDMYVNSFDQCKGEQNIVKDRAIFIAAYEMYRKAGDTQAMARMRSQFPSVEEAFTLDLNKGDKVTVGCWINETVSLQTRD